MPLRRPVESTVESDQVERPLLAVCCPQQPAAMGRKQLSTTGSYRPFAAVRGVYQTEVIQEPHPHRGGCDCS